MYNIEKRKANMHENEKQTSMRTSKTPNKQPWLIRKTSIKGSKSQNFSAQQKMDNSKGTKNTEKTKS